MPAKDFERLSTAMIVSKDFREKVLDKSTRVSAIDSGYLVTTFSFTKPELSAIEEIEETTNFAKFANALNKIKKQFNP